MRSSDCWKRIASASACPRRQRRWPRPDRGGYSGRTAPRRRATVRSGDAQLAAGDRMSTFDRATTRFEGRTNVMPACRPRPWLAPRRINELRAGRTNEMPRRPPGTGRPSRRRDLAPTCRLAANHELARHRQPAQRRAGGHSEANNRSAFASSGRAPRLGPRRCGHN